mgnify:CR=1 FL=1
MVRQKCLQSVQDLVLARFARLGAPAREVVRQLPPSLPGRIERWLASRAAGSHRCADGGMPRLGPCCWWITRTSTSGILLARVRLNARRRCRCRIAPRPRSRRTRGARCELAHVARLVHPRRPRCGIVMPCSSTRPSPRGGAHSSARAAEAAAHYRTALRYPTQWTRANASRCSRRLAMESQAIHKHLRRDRVTPRWWTTSCGWRRHARQRAQRAASRSTTSSRCRTPMPTPRAGAPSNCWSGCPRPGACERLQRGSAASHARPQLARGGGVEEAIMLAARHGDASAIAAAHVSMGAALQFIDYDAGNLAPAPGDGARGRSTAFDYSAPTRASRWASDRPSSSGFARPSPTCATRWGSRHERRSISTARWASPGSDGRSYCSASGTMPRPHAEEAADLATEVSTAAGHGPVRARAPACATRRRKRRCCSTRLRGSRPPPGRCSAWRRRAWRAPSTCTNSATSSASSRRRA